jgi:hypothetical protein
MAANDPRNPVNASGIYLYDRFGNLTLLHRDPGISSMNPIPLRGRQRPPVIADLVDWRAPEKGSLFVQDVYRGLEGIRRGAVRRIRVVGVLPIVQPQMNRPVLGVSREDTGKFILGTAPVAEDGSAWFRIPSGIPVFLQALDADGLAVRTMRSLTYVQPGTTLSCVGCHEPRDAAPPSGRALRASLGGPSKLSPDPDGSWPLRYDRLVQPVLDKLCVSCHRPGARDPAGRAFDLTPPKSYNSIMNYAGKDLHKLVFERDASAVGDCAARKSKFFALLTGKTPHEKVRLDKDSRYRLAAWMDTYGHRQGAFSDLQEQQLRDLRARMAGLLDE